MQIFHAVLYSNHLPLTILVKKRIWFQRIYIYAIYAIYAVPLLA